MDEIIELENQRIQAMTGKDIDALNKILADDLSYCHSSARLETKEDFISSITSGRTSYQSIDRDDVEVRRYGDTAVVTGQGKFHVISNGQDLRFQVRFTDVYAKREGVWQMVAWQSTKLPD